MSTEINWNGKLQVVHTDGRVVDLAEHEPWGNPSWPLKAMSADGAMVFYMDPSRNDVCAGAIGDGWTIRNALAPTPTPDERAVAPELVERMRKLVKTVANDASEPYSLRQVEDEARAIVAALEPVDTDLIEAREICGTALGSFVFRDGERDDSPEVICVLAALRRTASRDVTPCTREQFEEDCRA